MYAGAAHTGTATGLDDILVNVEVSVVIYNATPWQSSWQGLVDVPQGVCLQTFSLVDLRTLAWHPAAGDRMFQPQLGGSVSDCTIGPCPSSSPVLDYPELAGATQERSEDPTACWVPNGEDRAMGWMALLAAATHTSPAQAVYVGAHDPAGRIKLLPGSASTATGTAKLRVLHAPSSFLDSNVSTFRVPYPTVLAVVDGGWWDAAQIYRDWSLAHANWTRHGSLEQRVASGLLPAWAVEAPFWTRANGNCGMPPTYNNSAIQCIDQMIDLQRILSTMGTTPGSTNVTLPLGMHWYGLAFKRISNNFLNCDTVLPLRFHGGTVRLLKVYFCMHRSYYNGYNGSGAVEIERNARKHLLNYRECRYGWNNEMFDTHYPQYTIRPGVAAQVAKAKAAGIHVAPYTNGRLMDPTIAAWSADDAMQHACGCFEGKLGTKPPPAPPGPGLLPCDTSGAPGYYSEKYENNDQYMGGVGFALMNPNTPYWQQKLYNVTKQAVSAGGFDAVYVDQTGAAHPALCYDNGGGGGGSGWSDGNKDTLAAIAMGANHARPKGSEPVLILSESLNEQFMAHVGANLAIYDWEWSLHCSHVNAYQAVYGGYTLNIGDNRYPWDTRVLMYHVDHVDQQRGMLAQQFVAGQVSESSWRT